MYGKAKRRASFVLAGVSIAVGSTSSITFAQDPPSPSAASAAAGVNLNITPRRIVFDRTSRTATVYLFNQGDTPANFDVKLVDRVMLPNGEIRAADNVGENSAGIEALSHLASAHDLILATPRRVTLAPGRGQAVRLRASTPRGEGEIAEYRTHLTVSNLPPPDAGLTAEEAANPQPGRLSFQVRSLFGISIPVIVRTGTVDARAALSELNVVETEARDPVDGGLRSVSSVGMVIERLGANSLFGNVEIRGGSDGLEVIGNARGVGVYPEISSRALTVQLTRAPVAGEQLFVVFSDDDSAPGTELARATLVAP